MSKTVSQLISQAKQNRINLTYKIGFQTGIVSCMAFLLLYIILTNSLAIDLGILLLLCSLSILLAISYKFPFTRPYCSITASLSLLYPLYHDISSSGVPEPLHIALLASFSISFLMFFVKSFLMQVSLLVALCGAVLYKVNFSTWTTFFGYYILGTLGFGAFYYLYHVHNQGVFLCKKQNQQHLSKKKWEFLCDQSPNGILIVRPDFKVAYVNSTARTLLEQDDKNALLDTITGLVYKERFFASFFEDQSDEESFRLDPVLESQGSIVFDTITYDLKSYLASQTHKVVCFGILQFSRENQRNNGSNLEIPDNITNLSDYIEKTSQARTRSQMQKQGSFFIKGSKIEWKNIACVMLHVTQVPEDLEAAVSKTLSQMSCSRMDIDVGNIRDLDDELLI